MSEFYLNGKEVFDVQIDGVDSSDYPDMCDAYIYSANYGDATPLSDNELRDLQGIYSDWVQEEASELLGYN